MTEDAAAVMPATSEQELAELKVSARSADFSDYMHLIPFKCGRGEGGGSASRTSAMLWHAEALTLTGRSSQKRG